MADKIAKRVVGQEKAVVLLLRKKAELERRDQNELTPLMYAAHGGHGCVMELLLKAKALAATKDRFGRNAQNYGAANPLVLQALRRHYDDGGAGGAATSSAQKGKAGAEDAEILEEAGSLIRSRIMLPHI